MSSPVLQVAVPSPLRRLFDYLAPAGPTVTPGTRVRVPFGRREVVGLVVGTAADSPVPRERLKAVSAVLDDAPLLPPATLGLLEWAVGYYHAPPGEVHLSALPVALRKGKPAHSRGERRFRLTDSGRGLDEAQFQRAPRQLALVRYLEENDSAGAGQLNAAFDNWRDPMKRLEQKGWVASRADDCLARHTGEAQPAPTLNPGQREAVAAIADALGRFQGILLDGVTGSGKTEVYLQAVEQVIGAGRQALILVPEIGLTPQFVRRFQRRFDEPVAVLHSGLAEGERLCAWLAARDGRAPIVLGTRSAVFTPLARPGLIVVDEEHDASFKQQEGFRYSGRDVAVMRARREGVPVVLGSATPSLESLHNALSERYRYLHLPERAGVAVHPHMGLLDVRGQPMDEGLSQRLRQSMQQHLERGGQVLLFLNRRGYAPALLCHDCGWVGECRRCDAMMTVYAGERRLRCHHCGAERPVPPQCPNCGSVDLRPVGQGTERVAEALERHFPGVAVLRVDRDSTRRKGSMQALLERARDGRAQILVGTQMLAKGHHFPNVTLVGVLDADQGLFSADFRAGERMAQLIVQVAGRAGRAEQPGQVLIQTHHPEHPLLNRLVREGYGPFARATLEERREAGYPPFAFLALVRAEAPAANAPLQFLDEAAAAAWELAPEGLMVLGPAPSPMERRAGRFRAQLLLQAPSRAVLHGFVDGWLPRVEALKSGRRVRWSLDIDPADMF